MREEWATSTCASELGSLCQVPRKKVWGKAWDMAYCANQDISSIPPSTLSGSALPYSLPSLFSATLDFPLVRFLVTPCYPLVSAAFLVIRT